MNDTLISQFHLLQVLVITAEPGDISPQLDAVHPISLVSPLSVHPHICSLGDAVIWRGLQFSGGNSPRQLQHVQHSSPDSVSSPDR